MDFVELNNRYLNLVKDIENLEAFAADEDPVSYAHKLRNEWSKIEEHLLCELFQVESSQLKVSESSVADLKSLADKALAEYQTFCRRQFGKAMGQVGI